jgi:hypothetical protein
LTFHAFFHVFSGKKKEKNIKAHQVRFAQTWHCVSSGVQEVQYEQQHAARMEEEST